jgi:hypothetical protein
MKKFGKRRGKKIKELWDSGIKGFLKAEGGILNTEKNWRLRD